MRSKTRCLISIAAVAICCLSWAGAEADWVTMVDNGPSSNRVDLVFVGDGYTSGEISTTYVSHVEGMLAHMFAADEDPFPRYVRFFNVHRVDVVSNESGADRPEQGIYRDTALGASYSFQGQPERVLYVDELEVYWELDEALAGAAFTAEMTLVPVNDEIYGGASASYSVYAAGHASGPEIALHELGHSFSELGDEYWTAGTTYVGGEPDAVNVTASATGEKWARWSDYTDPDLGPIGVYEGAGGFEHGLYRSSGDSKMRSLGQPFGAVSREKIILDIYEYVDPLDDWLDNAELLIDPPSLSVEVVDPDVIQVEWYVDGERVVGATGESFDPLALGPGAYSITAHAYDDTPWVRLETNQLDQSVSWEVVVTVPEPGTPLLLASGLGLLMLGRQRRRRRGRRSTV